MNETALDYCERFIVAGNPSPSKDVAFHFRIAFPGTDVACPQACLATFKRRSTLANPGRISFSDLSALAAAAALVAAYAWLSRALLFPPRGHLLAALGITAAFALVGWLTRGVTVSGALAGFAVALVLAVHNLGMFWTLLVVFAITLVATRTGAGRKRQLRNAAASSPASGQRNPASQGDASQSNASGGASQGHPQPHLAMTNNASPANSQNSTSPNNASSTGPQISVPPNIPSNDPKPNALPENASHKNLITRDDDRGRSASQVMANLGVAALIMVVPSPASQFLALAALAEAAADTCSSELGMAFPGKTVLITTWKPVPPGMDGGVTVMGTLSALLAAALIAVTGRAFGLVSTHHMAAIVYAGFLGSLVDSLLGALLERRGWLNNDAVNLLGTATAVGMAWAMG